MQNRILAQVKSARSIKRFRILHGRPDTLDGGEGTDTVSYEDSHKAVSVDLQYNLASGGHATGDTLILIENLVGSDFDDSLFGDREDNALTGGDGDDVLNGRGGGDILDGGAGSNTASYATSFIGVTVNLADGTASGGDATGDTLLRIQNIEGSNYADVITGDKVGNTLTGLNGNDVLDGRAGDDVLLGGDGDDLLIGGLGNDILTGGAGDDIFHYDANGPSLPNYDKIADFQAGANSDDILELEGFGYTSFEDVLADSYQVLGNTVINLDANTSVTLIGVQITDLHQDDFLLL